MPVVLYGKIASPPCRAVMVAAKAIDLDLELKDVDMMGTQEHRSEKYLAMNPAHSVPCLDDDGFHIWESRAILGYLVDKYAKDDKLYPKDLKGRATVNNMLYFDIGNLLKSSQDYYMPMLSGDEPNPAKAVIVTEKLEMLDTILKNSGFAAGNHVTIADISLMSTVETMDVLKLDRSKFENINKWIDRVKEALPFYEDFVRPGIEMLTAFLNMRIAAAQKAKQGGS